MGAISLQIPQSGLPDATEEPKIATDLTTIQTWANGNIDATNISAGLAQAGSINQAAQTVKGFVNISAAQSTASTTYTTLATPDQVASVTLPGNGMLAVWYQAYWQETNVGASRAAIFVNSNQLQIADTLAGAPITTATGVNSGFVNKYSPLVSCGLGLVCFVSQNVSYGSDVTTGQIVGGHGQLGQIELGGVVLQVNDGGALNATTTGPVYIAAAAGTYTVSVRFKTSTGSVTATNRRLWVQALSFT